MRIGFLTTSYPRHPQDLSGCFVAEMAGWFAEQGDTLEVLAPAPASGDLLGVRVLPLRYALRPRLFYGAGAPDNLQHAWGQVPIFTGRMALECWRRSALWDAVISHWLLPCGFLAGVTSRGRAHLAVAHSSDVHLLARLPLASELLHAIARPRTRLLLTSESLRPHLAQIARTRRARHFVEDARVQRMGIPARPPAVDPKEIQALRRKHDVEHGIVVLFVGRLVSVKGVDLLLEACAGLARVTLVIVGDGPERTALEERARRLKVSARFVGEKLGSEKLTYLGAADILVLPSRVLPDGRCDSAPLVLLEGMAVGLPVIATRVGGNAELLRHEENGLLVPAGEIAPLRKAIALLAENLALRRRLGQEARETARRYTWDEVGPRLQELLLDL